VQFLCEDTQINPLKVDDKMFYRGNDKYTSAKFYNFIFQSLPQDNGLCYIWKSKSLPKLHVFAWLLLMDRLNTKDLMIRNIEDTHFCVLYMRLTRVRNQRPFFFQLPICSRLLDKISCPMGYHQTNTRDSYFGQKSVQRTMFHGDLYMRGLELKGFAA
jgi:hypothetical protein